MANKQVNGSRRRLRLALIWDGAIVAEEELEEPRPVKLGSGREALFPLPDLPGQAEEGLTLLEPHGQGYRLRIGSALGGSVWVGGERKEVSALARETSVIDLGLDDFGLVTLGPVGVFFQHVRPARKPVRQFFRLDGELAASIGLSAFVLIALLLVAFMDKWERGAERDPLELPPEVVTEYMTVPPPEDMMKKTARSAGTETERPGLRARHKAGGKAHEGREGRVGRQDAQQEQTDIAGKVREQVSAEVRDEGLLGALSGGKDGNAISEALDTPTASDILGGLGDDATVAGRGSGGAGLRGSGAGGGGDGEGSLFGAGDVGTGLGPGSGDGAGRGSDGPGARGRKAKEVEVSVSRGNANTNGYLSAEQINRVVRAHQAAIRYCYEREVQRQPNLAGRVVISWRVDLQGSVSTARVASSSLNNASVEGCIVRQVRQWQFPKPDGGECQVNYPFMFGLKGG